MTPDMQRTMVPVIYEKLRQWTPKQMLKGGSFDRSFDKQGASLRLECGCRFDFLSYEMDLNKFGGAALHRAHYDETPPASIRKECLMRLVDYGGDELFSLTPLKGLDFTFKDIWKRRDEPHIYAIKVGIDDNPTLDARTRDYVATILSSDEKEAAARLHGDFMHESGLVYPGWRSALTQPWTDAQIRRADNVVGLDPGIRYAGFTYTAFGERNEAHTWKATKLRNATAEDYAFEIRSTLNEVGLTLEDVDDELMRHEIFPIKADNSVEVGVKGIRRRIRNDLCSIADPDLGGDTLALTDELEELAMDIDENADDGEFKIVKINDHVSDAWRYAHQHRPWLPDISFGPERESGRAWWEVDDPRAHIARMREAGRPDGSVMGDMA
jgi:phage terminase large subunit-like protein